MNPAPASEPNTEPEATDTDASATPFATLTPDRVLDAVESIGFLPDGHLLALNSYENRVYQVGIDDGPPLVAKFYRSGRWSDAAILEEHAFALELSRREIPVIPPLEIAGTTLQRFGTFRFSVSPRRGGRDPALDDPEVLERIGLLLGRLHLVGACSAFHARPGLSIERLGADASAWLLDNDWLPAELRPAYRGVIEHALSEVRAAFARAGGIASLRLHGDCHRGNILWTDEGAHIVDLDDAVTGPAIQDLWMLLSGERDEMALQLDHVLTGYEQFRPFDNRELHLVEALRTLRQIHYAAWLARRWNDPAFPVAFPWFDTQRFWQDHILALREQIAAMQEGPLPLGFNR
ncbi:serine/threonine protein kinase [Thiohalocapsa marina]|uniref:Stress response kinase A n=1 Tax=Thiohalocapsa marina TaxID=424902 RepID=A0A5M8FQA5_9GAMM|nr:serine/threonine protein kinase [Thiohalocapsa marina]KAA6186230.1 serine/threonine protein kinase [Thiohalocapsa marina]